MTVQSNWKELMLAGAMRRKRWLTMGAVVMVMVLSLASQTAPQTNQRPNRITQAMFSGGIVTVAGTVHPLTQRATDVGAVNSAMQMDSLTLNIGLSATQQTELNALLEAQQDRKSGQYKQWLTQEQYGARFGLTDADLSAVMAWLKAQGFSVKSVSKSRNAIHFGGKVWQVESAFHTQLRHFQVKGETHFANATEIRVPAAIGSVMLNVRGLNNFRPKPHVQGQLEPTYTVSNGTTTYNFLSPADWATIYDVSPIYSAGYDGTGAHVGVVGQTYAPLADITAFRSAAGLSAAKVNYVCIDPTASHCTGTAAISTAGDLGEADLDIEWAGGIAKNATVDFVYAPYSDTCSNPTATPPCTAGVIDSVTGNYYDVFDALQHAVEDYTIPNTSAVLPVISMSYGDCEESFVGHSSYVSFVSALGQEANAQGQTIVVSSGDTGAFGCEGTNYPAQNGVSAGIPVDSPNYTGVGGTTLSGDTNNPLYWNETPNLVNSARQYIPEVVWNDTVNSLEASGGGVSLYFPQPTWQSGLISGQSTGRMVPDVAFASSPGHDGYMVCSSDNNSTKYGTSCATGFVSSTGYLHTYGGTSAGAPSFAGMLTLLVQKYGMLGNINPTLYELATEANYSTIFHAPTGGNNSVPCLVASSDPGCAVASGFGYSTPTSFPYYNMATGLGSIDGNQLSLALAGTSGGAGAKYTAVAGAFPATVAAGSSTSVTLTLTPTNYTGMVTLTATSSSPELSVSLSSSWISMVGGVQSPTLTIQTTLGAAKHAPARPWKSGGALLFCAVLLGAPFTLRRKRAIAVVLTALAISLGGFLVACGGGSGGIAPRGARAYTVTVTAVGAGMVTNPAPILITVNVP